MQKQSKNFSISDFFENLDIKKVIWIFTIVGLLVFFNGFPNDFVGDDKLQLVDNPYIHSVANIPKFFGNSTFYLNVKSSSEEITGSYYKPIMQVILSSIYTLFGSNPFFFHFIQLLIHIVNSILLYLLFKRFFKEFISVVLALIFLIHPINSESVLSISALQEPLFFLFGISGLLILMRFKSFKSLILSGLLFFLSLLSKETGTLFIIAAYSYLYLFDKKRLLNFIFVSVLPIISYFILKINAVGLINNPQNTPIARLSLIDRSLSIPKIIFFYFKTFFFPLRLSNAWRWVVTEINFGNFILPLIADLMLFGLFVYYGFYLLKKHRLKLKIYFWFTIILFSGLLLHLQIVPLDFTVSERWFYFPIIGLLGILGLLFSTVKKNILNSESRVVMAIIAIMVLSLLTFIRSFDWRSVTKLANHNLNVSSDDYTTEAIIGDDLFKKGKYEEAKVHAQRAIEMFPSSANYNLLGLINYKQGNYEEAKQAYISGLKYGELYGILYENIALLSLNSTEPDENRQFLEQALNKYPRSYKLWLYLAILEFKEDNVEVAKVAISKAYEYKPNDNSDGDRVVEAVYKTIYK